ILLIFITKNLKDISEDICSENLDDFEETLQALNIFNLIDIKKFLNISEENIIYEVLTDDQIINELVYLFSNTDKNFDSKELDNS
ncbi:30748_t:CDS:1, partial [Racocetra persica]